MKNKKYFSLIIIILMIILITYCSENQQETGFVKIDKDIDYFTRINNVFRTDYDIMNSVSNIQEMDSDLYVYESDTMAIKTVVQFGGFTKEERSQVSLNNHITGVRLGYIVNPENMVSSSSRIELLIRLEKDDRKVVGWKFTLDTEEGKEIINAIENEMGKAGIVHDAFGWQSEDNRYLYTIYPKAITFTVISNKFMNNLLSVLGINQKDVEETESDLELKEEE